MAADIMSDEPSSECLRRGVIFRNPDQCLPAAEPTNDGLVEIQLKKALAKCEALLLEKDELIHRQELLKDESDHRWLNDLQMTISLLSMQSRNSANPEVAEQLAAAANRVSMIARIHRRLNSYKGAGTIEFRKFLEDFCRDFSTLLSSDGPCCKISIEGGEVILPASIGIPLGFIASELITNAAKYGAGRIAIRLEAAPKHGYVLSVANDGPALPEGFDPAASNGLGMKIIQSFVRQINGELRIGRAEDGSGARFTVLFPVPSAADD
ncbi:sensor histidine kinase [Bradyrhizobium sp.]|uniref:sensor histidine kinase n=1 Tax=Bradyrhizobium sp. TaxID=376 RepID=UPI0027344529|nr:sensor histidine kinase [Bradyrhizobium sp.]MDP3690660.1 sensor histidine kinase [Bradyrhizobium sp.]